MPKLFTAPLLVGTITSGVIHILLYKNGARHSITCSQGIVTHLTEQLEREPTRVELAGALGVRETELVAFQTEAQPRQLVSFDEMTENSQGEESLSLTERLADPYAPRPDAAMLFDEDRGAILQSLGRLPKTQATVIVLHYLQNVPLREVAEILDVTPSRVSQLHHQALAPVEAGLAKSVRLNLRYLLFRNH